MSPLPPRKSRFQRARGWDTWADINQGVFQALLVVYLGLLFLEALRHGTVSAFLRFRYLLLLVFLSAIGVALAGRSAPARPAERYRGLVVGAAFVVTLGAVFYRLQPLGWVRAPLAIVSAAAVGIAAWMLLTVGPDTAPGAAPMPAASPPSQTPPRGASTLGAEAGPRGPPRRKSK